MNRFIEGKDSVNGRRDTVSISEWGIGEGNLEPMRYL